MNETRSTHRRGRISGRLAVVLCLALVVGLLPAAAFAVPATVTDAKATYINSATINMTPARGYQLDGGWTFGAAPSVTTSIYGPHVLSVFATWKSYSLGTTQTVMEIPFFVDDDVRPVATCNAGTSYVTTAVITVSATDNFSGSGVDSLFYRLDGGNIVQVIAPAGVAAAKAAIARLPIVAALAAPPLATFDQVPPHADFGACGTCHELAGPGPEPTGTPLPGTRTFTVTGLGSHTVEYWANDVARNESVHGTKTFSIVAPAAVTLPTTLTIKTSSSSVKRYSYMTLSGVLGGGAPAGSAVRIIYRKAGSVVWNTFANRATATSGAWSYRFKLSGKGTYYFKATYAGVSGFGPSTSGYVRVSTR